MFKFYLILNKKLLEASSATFHKCIETEVMESTPKTGNESVHEFCALWYASPALRAIPCYSLTFSSHQWQKDDFLEKKAAFSQHNHRGGEREWTSLDPNKTLLVWTFVEVALVFGPDLFQERLSLLPSLNNNYCCYFNLFCYKVKLLSKQEGKKKKSKFT